MLREAQCQSISESFIFQELGQSHNRTHPLDFSTDIFLSTLQTDPDTTSVGHGTNMHKPEVIAISYGECMLQVFCSKVFFCVSP